jgi:DNA-binding response OmpR family regulator
MRVVMTRKVLVVEDEPIIALEIEGSLRDAGFDIAGCAGSVDNALAMLMDGDCDVAVLDANLRGRTVEPVALALRQRGRPFLFVSGYGRVYLPEAFPDAPHLSKPFEPGELITAVRQLLS